MRTVRDLVTLAPKWNVTIKSPPRLRDPRGRGGRKNARTRAGGAHQGNNALKYTYEFTVWQHAQGLHKSKSSGVPELRGEVDTSSPTVTQKISTNDNLSQMKN